jgi:protein-S-isoprenylcysteine O-methyltransferase Ste14
MDIKILVIIAFSYLYGFFELFMSMRLKQKRKQDIVKSVDKASIWILIIFIMIGYFLSFWIGATKIGRIFHWNTFFAIGVILTLVGLVIRISSIMTLKQHFTFTVTKIENHELIETGLYKIIRHPGYLGQLIIFAGIATSLSNWLSILLMIISALLGYIYRIKTEERFMIEQMGQKYIDYQNRTKKLIPMIY